MFSIGYFARWSFCKALTNIPKNSIEPSQHPRTAFGYYFPIQWQQQQIYSILDPRKIDILNITRLKNRIGQFNGKIVFQFINPQTMQKYVRKYNEDYITTRDSVHKVVLKPYQSRTNLVKRQNVGYKVNNCVKISNLNFEIKELEIRKLASDYGQVQHIDMQIRPNGLNRGYCKVYFTKKQSVGNFHRFIDGLQYEERKLKAQIVQKKEDNWRKQIQKQFLQIPKKVFAANRELAQRESLTKKDYIQES